MKKLISLLILTAILALSACGGPSGPSAPPSPSASASASPSVSPAPSPSPSTAPSPSPGALTAADFFPFTPNVHMSYLGTGMEFAGFEQYVDYINNGAIQLRTNNTGTETVSVYRYEDSALKKVFSQGETYYMYDYTGQNTMSDVLIMEPIAVGTSWTSENGDQRSITATDAAVTVPYGSFTALEVTTVHAGSDSTSKNYYVQDLGLVKSDYILNNDTANPITSALQAVTTEPFTQTIAFFYPDFTNEQIVWVNKSIQFSTNDTAAPKLEAEFKTVPTGSGLTPLMSAEAVINNLTFDPNTMVATIDLSSAFITGMNAGSMLEGMILESIGDTLGVYFQTDKVGITIDGAPYESGHFLFNTGEYLPYSPDQAVVS